MKEASYILKRFESIHDKSEDSYHPNNFNVQR